MYLHDFALKYKLSGRSCVLCAIRMLERPQCFPKFSCTLPRIKGAYPDTREFFSWASPIILKLQCLFKFFSPWEVSHFILSSTIHFLVLTWGLQKRKGGHWCLTGEKKFPRIELLPWQPSPKKQCSLKLALHTALYKVEFVIEFLADTAFLSQIRELPPKKPEASSNLG